MAQAHFPNVHAIKRPNGDVYYYHRRTRVRLPGPYGSPDFARAWAIEEARASEPPPKPAAESYAGLIEAFKISAEWQALAPLTQRDYNRVIDWTMLQGAERRPAAELQQERCEKLRDLAVKEHGYRFGRYVVQFHRRLWNWVLASAKRKRVWGKENPWGTLELPQRPKGLQKRHPTWRPEEIAVVLDHAHLGLARSFVLAASGCAAPDILARRWPEYNGESFEPINREKTGVTGYPTVPGPLRPWLDHGPRPSELVATNGNGEPWASVKGFQTCASDFLRKLAKRGLIRPGLNTHGLRHTLATALADDGAGLRAIQGALQHKTARMALHYSEEADKRRLAREGVNALDGWFGDHLENVVPFPRKKKRKAG